MRDLEPVLPTPAPTLEGVERLVQIGDAIHEHRPIALQVIGQQDERRIVAQLDGRHPRPHRVDREHHSATEDLAEPPEILGDVAAGDVEEVERAERRRTGHYAAIAATF